MSIVETIRGSFAGVVNRDPPGTIFVDMANFPITTPPLSKYSRGVIRVTELDTRPTVDTWEILGWTVKVRIAFFQSPGVVDGVFPSPDPVVSFMRLGDLWTGLIFDDTLPIAGGGVRPQPAGAGSFLISALDKGLVSLPQDLSTFAKVWDGANDELRTAKWSVSQNPIAISPDECSLIAGSLMLPVPQRIPRGTTMSMALVMTPSLFGTDSPTALRPGIAVQSCDFTIIYQPS